MTGSLRTVLAVLLATALLAAAAPAVDRAREERATSRLSAESRDLVRAARALDAGSDATTRRGARRTLRLRIPDGGLVVVRASGDPRGTAPVAWRLDGGPWHERGAADRSGSGRRPVALRPVAGPLRLGPGTHRVRLSLVAPPGQPVVRVGRVGPPAGPGG